MTISKLSKLYVHKVLNRLSLSQLRQLAGEFKMDSRGSKSQLITRLINPVQIGGTDPIGPIGPVSPISPVDYSTIGGQLEAILLSHIDSYTGELNTPIEQIKNLLDEADIKYDYSPKEWFKILLSSKIINKIEPRFDVLPVFVNSLNVLPELSYGELKLLNSYYPKTLNIDKPTLEAKRQSDLVELQTWLASYGNKYSIDTLSNLIWLNLGGTPLESLPDSIGALFKLNALDLTGTPLESLPDSIGALFKLNALDLTGTSLRSLPNSIGNLSNLQWLNLTGTPLESLPDSIGNLSNLRELGIRGTQLKSLPDSIGNLSNLRELWIGKTRLKSLPVVQKLRNRGVTVYT